VVQAHQQGGMALLHTGSRLAHCGLFCRGSEGTPPPPLHPPLHTQAGTHHPSLPPTDMSALAWPIAIQPPVRLTCSNSTDNFLYVAMTPLSFIPIYRDIMISNSCCITWLHWKVVLDLVRPSAANHTKENDCLARLNTC